jgi:protein phosphatase
MVRGWLAIAHVGDSRAYLVRQAEIRQLTTDHNWAEDERKKGMSEQALRESPFRSMLTRAIGVENRFQPDISWTRMEPGDLVVLATDGLTHYADSDTLLGLVANGTDLAGIATGLIDYANDAGGRDNITVLLARFEGLAGSPLPDPDTKDSADRTEAP